LDILELPCSDEVRCALLDVINDPLWKLFEPNAQDNNALLLGMQLNGVSLDFAGNAYYESVLGCPSWKRLKYVVPMLCCDDVRLSLVKLWIKKNFTLYLLLLSLDLPDSQTVVRFYELFDAVFNNDVGSRPFRWPGSCQDFLNALEQLVDAGAALNLLRWVSEGEGQVHTWLWCLAESGRGRERKMLQDQLCGRENPTRPKYLASRVNECIRRDQSSVIEMDF